MSKENTLLKEYVNKIGRTCGDGLEYIITLKHDKKSEAFKKVLAKWHLTRTIAEILANGKYKDKSVTLIFKTGKLVIRPFHKREEAEDFLEELLE